ncbi:MAG: hypothetical protein CSA49_07570 [Gammaproteobacteria bacterium]|nr:MAG: hypothetical protein CSA49_07570 [Gammaproteobacteria bacterium]
MFDLDKVPLQSPSLQSPPLHGGRLQQAIAAGSHSKADWIDLSTGINPDPWPVPQIPTELFHRLPENNQALEQAAHAYYSQQYDNQIAAQHLCQPLAIPGSQWFIQQFPQTLQALTQKQPLNLLLPAIGFKEHEYWWQQYQHSISHYHDCDLDTLLSNPVAADVMVIINPNNPTTWLTPAKNILHAAHHNPDTLFIVDEAFMDTTPEHSVLINTLPANMIVLRSLGKFFGLAGLRVGFVFCHPTLKSWLSHDLGPWPIATASQWLATQALGDTLWQANARKRLKQRRNSLLLLLEEQLKNSSFEICATDYFITLNCHTAHQAHNLFERFKACGVLIRYIENTPLLRIGLPNQRDLARLAEWLPTILRPNASAS